MSWQSMTLGDVVTLKRGHDLPERDRREGPVPIVSSSGVTGFHNVAKAEPPGVVTGRYGTLGEVYFINEPYWPLNTSLYAIDFHENDPKFVSYFLRQVLKGASSNNKAAVPGVNRNDLHALKVNVPVRDVQERIAGMLTAYDDLIENNLRRIKLLEGAARLIYREWFVRLRFPGHETTKFENGIPEGWSRVEIREVAPFSYGKGVREHERIPGDVPVMSSAGQMATHNKALVEGPGLVIGRKGSVGTVHLVIQDFWPTDTAFYVSSVESLGYLFHAFQSAGFINTDVAVPGLNRDFAHSRKILWPEQSIRDEFSRIVLEHAQMKFTLERSNAKLGAARDLLLPRLMSGDIEV